MAATSPGHNYRSAPNMRQRTQGRPQSPQEHGPTRSMSSSATSLTPDSIQVPPDIIRKWQEIVDLLAAPPGTRPWRRTLCRTPS